VTLTELEALRLRVLEDLDEYVYSVPPTALGRPLLNDYTNRLLSEMRDALVQPYVVTMRMCQSFHPTPEERRECVIVADDRNGNLLFYDPLLKQFGLAMLLEGELCDICVPGDAVGCFMAR
jgi:hypothetical protein